MTRRSVQLEKLTKEEMMELSATYCQSELLIILRCSPYSLNRKRRELGLLTKVYKQKPRKPRHIEDEIPPRKEIFGNHFGEYHSGRRNKSFLME